MIGICNQPLWTPEKFEQLCSLIGQGKRYAEAASIMGLTYNQVMGKWRRKPRAYPANKSPWTPELHDRVCKLRLRGVPVREIAQSVDLTFGQVIGRLNRAGLCEPSSRHRGVKHFPRYTGSTMKSRLDALHGQMDKLLEQSIPRIPVPAQSNTGRSARRGDGFGVRALGHGQNGFRAVRAPQETSR